MNTSATNEPAPTKPGLVLNVVVAGARAIAPEMMPALTTALGDVLSELDAIVAGIKPGTSDRYELAAHYSTAKPVIRLVSGLADGADLLAAKLHRDRESKHVTHELGAVLAFDRLTYRDKSAVADKQLFNELIAQCRWVHELDGHYAADATGPNPTAEEKLFPKRCRARAYRAQSDILLRQCDLLIAVSDPNEPGRAGGTRETLASAVAMRLPVVHISLVDGHVRLVKTRAEADDLPFGAATADWRTALDKTIAEILAAPYRMHLAKSAATPGKLSAEERKLFDEFFAPAVPKDGPLNWVWKTVDRALRDKGGAAPETDIAALSAYRHRASKLSSHYSGKYRGAFVANFSLAVLAVLLAATSLLVALWLDLSGHAKEYVLVILGLAKLGIVLAIYRTTERANAGRWNELAVDYRYISERLRAMNYLPQLGLLRAPMPSATQTSTRRLQQTIADWLALAIIRQAGLEHAAGNGVDVPASLAAIKDHWLGNQAGYHRATENKMERMSSRLAAAAGWFTFFVVGFVIVDLALAASLILHLPWIEEIFVQTWTPLLLFLATVLPAAVAGANGIRFQSESDRLAERSNAFARILDEVRADAEKLHKDVTKAKSSSADPGSWVGPAALLAEGCAQLFLDEVAEWSVLYAKELGDA